MFTFDQNWKSSETRIMFGQPELKSEISMEVVFLEATEGFLRDFKKQSIYCVTASLIH